MARGEVVSWCVVGERVGLWVGGKMCASGVSGGKGMGQGEREIECCVREGWLAVGMGLWRSGVGKQRRLWVCVWVEIVVEWEGIL